MKKTIASVAAGLAAVIGFAAPAAACHPELDVNTDCESIVVTATAWASDDASQRLNPDVRVTVDGVEVGRGKFTTKAPSFTVTAETEPGERTVRVVAVAPWGKRGEHGDAGSSIERKVTVPDCGGEYGPVIPAPPRPEIIDAPELEQAPVVVPVTTEVVHAEIASSVVLEAQPPVLAFTGRSSWATALAAVGFLVAGAGLVSLGRRR